MKAQRRHELQTNSLAQFLENVPLYLRFHLGKILFGLLVVLVVIMLVRYRINTAREGRAQLNNAVNDIRRSLSELQGVEITISSPVQRVAERRNIAGRIESTIDQILQETEDPDDSAIRAEALVARGDLNWTLANLPQLPEATTQPELRLDRSNDEYLDAAERAYREVLQKYPQREISAITAMFGLAAIAENRSQWDVAADQYQAIIDRKDTASTFKNLAQFRLRLIPTIQQPIYMGTLTTQPATRPATTLANTVAAPTTGPTNSAVE